MSAKAIAAAAPTPAPAGASRARLAGICIVIATMVWVVFGQTLGFEFVNLDDNENIYENPVVAKGLSAANIGWAFTHTQVSRWVPLSTLAHMIDAQLYGLKPAGHHLTCVLLHTLGSVLLFLVLHDATRAAGRSALVAMLFAVHPLHVEAVAWVSTLQYTLSGVFFMLTLWAYLKFVRGPSPGRYVLLAVMFVCGLLAKEMLVTVPAVLLLLDFWPLNRWAAWSVKARGATPEAKSFGRLFLEKVPLFAFSAISCVVTLIALRSFRQPVDTYPWPVRIGNALVSYAAYVGQMFFPQGLAAWYPHPGGQLGMIEVLFSAIMVLGVTAGAYRLRRTQPYLLIGWLWYLGVLFPVIGLVQRGEQARCDRYTYLSQIGLYIMITWGATEIATRLRWPRRALVAGAGIVVVALMACSYVQAGYWRNSEALWKHALAHTSRNYVAHLNLAVGLAETNRLAEALPHFQQAVQLRPTSPEAQNNYGYALASMGRFADAVPYYQAALRLKPDFVNALLNLGDALTALGRANEARTYYAAAEKILGQPQGPAR